MTRKDYDVLAASIKEALATYHTKCERETIRGAVDIMMDKIAASNANFNREKFREAATLTR